MAARVVDPAALPTWTFDWGLIKPLTVKEDTEEGTISMVHVVVLPGLGHDRHNHPEADELLYILSGEGEQMLDDGEPFRVSAGETVLIPKGVWHSTINTGWEPMSVLAIYAPAGPEKLLKEIPGFREVAAGEQAKLARD
ncbi:MAG TPA: cupin domain-containing protein [Solirubrobacterales bacterium]|nr:cupin domain-containing protein [Solirubrobacterales bacterium]